MTEQKSHLSEAEFEAIQSLLPVASKEVDDGREIETVDARELHEFLGVATKFADWIKRRIDEYGFVQGIDFIAILNNENSPPSREYHLTLDMAKELGMVEKTEKGRLVRRYFLECERLAREAFDAMTDGERLLYHAKAMVRMERRQKEIAKQARQADRMAEEARQRVATVEAKVDAVLMPSTDFAVMGYANYIGRPILLDEAKIIGRLARKLSLERGVAIGKVRDPRFGEVNTYLESILSDAFSAYFKDRDE